MKRSGKQYLYSLFISIFLLLLLMPEGIAQVTSISGTINSYSKVNAVRQDEVDLADNIPGFAPNDKVLLIQMKGASLNLTGSIIYGTTINDTIGYPGHYEFIIIDAVAGTTVTFKNDIIGSYDPESYVQLVKLLPQYENVSVDGILSCPAWDEVSGTGGVLAFMVDNNVILNSNIDVSEKGFEGGVSDIIQGLSINGVATGDDPNMFNFTEAENKAARKGKGVGSHIGLAPFSYTDYARGKGRFGTAGGGGNGLYSGGGGGSSYGTGGQGGVDQEFNSGQGLPGEEVSYFGALINRPYLSVLMGSGGGAGGTGSGGGDIGSDGGRGGGIIIILADSIFGNGNSIISNGEDVWPVADNNGGAGGGGAAGAIVISAKYSTGSALTISAEGGDGGHSYNPFGSGYGGGGSGGLIFTNNNPSSFGVTTSVSMGEEGYAPYTGSPSGTTYISGDGEVLDTLLIRLNGFLFNTIVSDVTKSRVDSICFGDSAPLLVGSVPTGGSGTYDFKWIRKKDSDVVWDTIPGETGKDMDLTVAEDDTVSFKRVVFDRLQNPKVIDVSKEIKIIVQPLITGNTVGHDTIICFNQDPDALLPIDILGGGNFDSGFGDSTFTWHSSLVNNADHHTWGTALNVNNERSYDPAALTDTTYYYRAVQSGRCYDTSNIVTVTVLPLIAGNTIGADQVICEDQPFVNLTGPATTGGDGSYTIEWRISTDDVSYSAATGTVDQLDFDPDEPTFVRDSDQLLRRFVWSGDDDVCVDSSNVVTLKMWSDITGNTIYSDQTITANGPVGLLTGDPLGGSDPGEAFTYLWQQSSDNISWVSADGANTDETYQPVNLEDTTYYRRKVTRLPCEEISNVVVINVHPSIADNTITTQSGTKDTIICIGQDPNILLGSLPAGGDEVTYIYKWEKSTDNINFSDADGIIAGQDYDPPSLNQTTFFRRNVSSGESTGISDTLEITVLPDITANTISGDQTICYNTPFDLPVEGPEPGGGAGAGTFIYLWEESTDNSTWVDAAGTNTNIGYVPPANLVIPMYYRRVAKSGLSDCCVNTSNAVLVDIYDLPIGTITAISAANSCAADAITISLDMSAAGQAPYAVVLDDGDGGTESFSATTDVFDYTFNPSSSGDFSDFTYQFSSLIDLNGCVATNMTGTENLRVYTVPTATISASTLVEVCGLDVTLVAEASVGTGLWTSPDATILSASAATSVTNDITVQDYGPYTFKWTETNWTCVDEATIEIIFDEQPAPVDAGTGASLLPLSRSFDLNADPNSVSLTDRATSLWTTVPADGPQLFLSDIDNVTTVSNLVDGMNVLKWTVGNGVCLEESDTIMLDVTLVLIPDGYSPNMDGINDFFEIKGLDNMEVKAELVITDMNGIVVYENPEYHNEWDGRNSISNEYLPDGTYYYFLRINEPEKRQIKGYIIIKRSIAAS